MSTFQLHPQLAADCFVVCDLTLCRLLMMNDKNYPWFILVPMREGLREAYELSEVDQIQLNKESTQLACTLMMLFNGKKMNVAALGNVVPQLHIHHIVRFEGDASWPKPVWGQVPKVLYSEAEAQARIAKIKAAFFVGK